MTTTILNLISGGLCATFLLWMVVASWLDGASLRCRLGWHDWTAWLSFDTDPATYSTRCTKHKTCQRCQKQSDVGPLR